MKQKDLALIIGIAGISAVVSFVVSNRLFVTPSNRQQQVEDVDVISASFQAPDTKYFNPLSINPAPSSSVGGDNNQNPFNGDNH